MARYQRYSKKEEEMLGKLTKTVGTILAVIVTMLILFTFFGPKLGSAFLIFSKHRNDKGVGDIIPPAVPIFSQVPDATNSETIKLDGITEEGSKIKLFVNGPEKAETTADSSGNFTFTDIKLLNGNNIIFVKAIDSVGNESKSQTLSVIYDTEKPEIDILEPIHGSTVKNLNSRVLVKGKLNEEGNVTINDRQAIVNSDNSFELLIGVSEGNVTIKVVATDKAGNREEKAISISYSKE